MLAILLLLSAAQDVVVRGPAKPTPQQPATMVLEPAAMLIATFDADGDARTTRDEVIDGVARSFASVDPGGTGQLRYLAFADWSLRWLGDRNALPSPFEVDRDSDDKVSLDELQDQFSRLFSRYDTDGDKAVSRAELLTFKTGPIGRDGPAGRRGGKGDRGRDAPGRR